MKTRRATLQDVEWYIDHKKGTILYGTQKIEPYSIAKDVGDGQGWHVLDYDFGKIYLSSLNILVK